MSEHPTLNYEAALEAAYGQRKDSNLARCYIAYYTEMFALKAHVDDLEVALLAAKSAVPREALALSQVAVNEHAEMMLKLAHAEQDADNLRRSLDGKCACGLAAAIDPTPAAPSAEDRGAFHANDCALKYQGWRCTCGLVAALSPPPAPLGYQPEAASLALVDRPCTCHPDDNPPLPCPRKYALQDCRAAAEYRYKPKMEPPCGACGGSKRLRGEDCPYCAHPEQASGAGTGDV